MCIAGGEATACLSELNCWRVTCVFSLGNTEEIGALLNPCLYLTLLYYYYYYYCYY